MLRTRVIPVLLLRGSGLVKTVRFDQPKYVGDPINAVKIFNEKEVDELVFLDIEASKKGREPNFELLEWIAGECFMPLCYGGGVTSLEQARRIVGLGVEKISVNSAALRNSELVSELARVLGSSSVVVGVDVKRDWLGRYRVFDASSGSYAERRLNDYVRELEARGAGEILLNSVDRDGEQQGYDLKLIEQVCSLVNIPVIACGGASKLTDFYEAASYGAAAAAAGSLFVFQGKHRAVLISYPPYGELQELLGNK